MRAHEATLGRTFVVAFDHGDDYFEALADFCGQNNVRQGFIPSFIAGFRDVDIVGTCEKIGDPMAPVWTKVHLENVEAFGGGSIAFDEERQAAAPHIHVAVGLKAHSAVGHTSHLLAATVQFLTEMLVVEIVSPTMRRVRNPDLNDVPLIDF